MTGRQTVLIAGGGIGGLALAIALAQNGVRSHILERRQRFSEAGAGIQIGPNGVRVLRDLNIATQLENVVGRPQSIAAVEGSSGRIIQTLPLGDWIEKRHGAPYWVAHRADLQTALLSRARELSNIKITTGFAINKVDNDHDRVIAYDDNGNSETGFVLVGADGLWSTIRSHVAPTAQLQGIGKMAMRTVITVPSEAGLMSEPVVGAWMAPDVHVVHYPVRGGREVAIVIIATSRQAHQGWGQPIDLSHVRQFIPAFASPIRDTLGEAQHWRSWSLFECPPLECWSRNRITLLGDAAHPILPFLAQGGVMALEDAVILARHLADNFDRPGKAFARYETDRSRRVRRLQNTSRQNGQIYSLGTPMSVARNLSMAAAGGARLMRSYDWIYGWNLQTNSSR